MTVESEDEILHLKKIGRIVGTTLKGMMQAIEVGMTTLELDQIGAKLLQEQGASSAPQLSYNFPGATCISINEEAAHGIPGARKIQAGDVVNIDVSAELNGYFGDTGGTIVVPPSNSIKQRVCHATRIALQEAIKKARADQPINQIGKAIEKVAKRHNLKVIKNLCSHGVGRKLHEEPKSIASYFEPKDTRILKEGMVITIEPFLSTKSSNVIEADDGWTLLCSKGNISAQYEHSMVITKGMPILLTAV